MSQIISNSISAPLFDTSYVKYACRFDRQPDCVCATASLSKICIACAAEMGLPTDLVAPLGLEPKKVCTVFGVMFTYRCLQYVSGHIVAQIDGRVALHSHCPRDMRPMQARSLSCGNICSMRHCAILLHGDVPLPKLPIIHTWLCVINDALKRKHELLSNLAELIFLTISCATSYDTGSLIV